MSGRLFANVSAFLLFVIAGIFCITTSASAQSTSTKPAATHPVPALDSIVERLRIAADQNRLRWSPYRLLREYQMFRERNATPMAKVKAELVYDPNGKNGYQILECTGNERGAKIVSKLLDSEASGWAKFNEPHPPTALSRDNYTFTYQGTEMIEGHRTYVLGLHPLRKEAGLIDGTAWVDAESYLVRKIVGIEAKSPSWWVHNVALTLTFGPVGGMWLQTMSQAVADIRIIGRYTMVGKAVEVRAAEVASSEQNLRAER